MTQNQSELSDPQNRLKNILKNSLDIILKESAYKKKGLKYQLQGPYFLYEIKIRKSKHSSKIGISFTIDFDIWLPKEVTNALPFPFLAPVLGGDACNIGKINNWFFLNDDDLNWQTKDEEFVEKIKDAMLLYVLPFMGSINSLQDITPLLKENEAEYKLRRLDFIAIPCPGRQTREWLAIIFYILKDNDKSIEIIDQSINSFLYCISFVCRTNKKIKATNIR